jgi:predicted phage terminase large subunit-like protein
MANHENLSVKEDDLVASICRDSFYDFVQEFWSTVITEKPVWNWHIKFLCDQMQEIAERVFRGEPKKGDVIINIPPGTTKSTLLSVLFPAWVWTRMPSARFICGSFTHPLALDLSRKCRDVIVSEKYIACFPEVALAPDQNTKGYFTTTARGMRYAVSVGGSVTGLHAHFIIIDDPLDPNQAASDEELKNANSWVSETLPTRKVNKEITVTIIIMQRLHQNDPTGMLLDKKKEDIIHFKLPAELKDGPYPPELGQHYVNGFLDPIRLNAAVLAEALKDLGPHQYACQFKQHPVPEGGAMFNVERFKAWLGIPHGLRLDYDCRFWDKAGTAKGGNFTVGTRIARFTDVITKLPCFLVIDVVRGQWDSNERERVIVRTAAQDGRGVRIGIEQEPGSGGKESAEATLRRLAGYRVTLVKPSGDKTQRADEYSTQVNGGAVYYLIAPWNAEWLKEHMFFPYGTYDDQVDSASGAFTMAAFQRKRIGAI